MASQGDALLIAGCAPYNPDWSDGSALPANLAIELP
jgi:hypothetical protein